MQRILSVLVLVFGAWTWVRIFAGPEADTFAAGAGAFAAPLIEYVRGFGYHWSFWLCLGLSLAAWKLRRLFPALAAILLALFLGWYDVRDPDSARAALQELATLLGL